jgi:hypothetical protein
MELIVSADYVHAWKQLRGEDLGDGPVGFFGAASSLLILSEGVRSVVQSSS